MAWSEVWLQQGVHGLGFFSFMVLALVPRYPPLDLTQKYSYLFFFFSLELNGIIGVTRETS